MAPHRLALGACVLAWPLLGAAQPKVCGNQTPLGDFNVASCRVLLDDGVMPDAVKGDGVYSTEVQLVPTQLLEYKVLPSGAFGADQIQQVGDCDPQGGRTNPFSNIQVPKPDTSGPARFSYDSNGRTAGDSLMTASPAGSRWVVVGSFQEPIFDPARGAVALSMTAPGVLAGTLVAERAAPPGWEWKVLEGLGTYDKARKYGTDGWSYSPCDSKNVVMSQGLAPGDRVEFQFFTGTGRLQATITHGSGGDDPAPPPDLPPPGDLRAGDGGGGDMLDPAALPGIRCSCRLAGAPPPPSSKGLAAAALLLFAALGRLAARRRRHGRH